MSGELFIVGCDGRVSASIRNARSRISGEHFLFIEFHPCLKNGPKVRPIQRSGPQPQGGKDEPDPEIRATIWCDHVLGYGLTQPVDPRCLHMELVAYSQTNGLTLNLYVRESTTFSRRLQELIDSGVITRVPNLGP